MEFGYLALTKKTPINYDLAMLYSRWGKSYTTDMMTDFSKRKQHWEKQYSQKDPLEVSWYQKEPALSMSMIAQTGIGKDACIIDVGGGASLLVDRLQSDGYSCLSVLDISGKSLEVSKLRLAGNAQNIDWIEEDITKFVAPRQYSLWHDRAVFHFLTQASDRGKYVQALKKSLVPGGHVVLAAFALGGPTKCSGLDIVQYDSAKLLNEFGPEFSLVGEAFETHMTPAGKGQEFRYFQLVRR
jgi:2-polyprenyl-3-methyl-5-hydroxy-6-metoxy-1,4-benzoquinol methylase